MTGVKCFLILICLLEWTEAVIVNEYVTRMVNIQTPIVKEMNTIVIKNDGLNSINSYDFVLEPGMEKPFIKVLNEKSEELDLETNRNAQNNSFTVVLNRKVNPNDTYMIIAELAYAGNVIPYQRTRKQNDTEVLYYKGNTHFYSPYATNSLRTIYICKPDAKLSVTLPVHIQRDNQLVYKYSTIKPYSLENVNIVFEYNEPILVVTDLLRTIDVSHFGKIFVEDCVTLKNKGARLVGPYEPILRQLPKQATSWLYTHLPASADDVQFFDDIGNNSKSQMLYFGDYNTFKYQPRYPLLGGWKTKYTLRYSLPAHEYLTRNLADYFNLQIRAVDHVLNDGYIKRATVKILLPEGAYLVEVEQSKWLNREEDVLEYTSLCFFGRPTIVLNGSMLLESHISNVTIKYLFSDWYLCRVPLLIAVYLEVVFFVIVLFRRYLVL